MAIELSYINTKHPDFQREAAMVGSLMAPESLRHPSSRHDRHDKPAKNRPGQLATNLPAITNGEHEKENLMPKVSFCFYFRFNQGFAAVTVHSG